jgi:hypothetical protein
LRTLPVRSKPQIKKKLEPKQYASVPTQGWKERGTQELPLFVRKAARQGFERLAARDRAERDDAEE